MRGGSDEVGDTIAGSDCETPGMLLRNGAVRGVALVPIERFLGGDLGGAAESALDHRLEVARGHTEATQVRADEL